MKNKILFAAIGVCLISISSLGVQKLNKPVQLEQAAGLPAIALVAPIKALGGLGIRSVMRKS